MEFTSARLRQRGERLHGVFHDSGVTARGAERSITVRRGANLCVSQAHAHGRDDGFQRSCAQVVPRATPRGASFGCVRHVIDDELLVERELALHGVGVDFVGAHRVCVCLRLVLVRAARLCENIDVSRVVARRLDGKRGRRERWGVRSDNAM